VHFDGANSSITGVLSVADSPIMGCVFWVLPTVPMIGSTSIFAVVPAYENYAGGNTGNGIGFGTQDDSFGTIVPSSVDLSAGWQCVIAAINATTGVAKIYFGDTDVTGTINFSGAASPLWNGLQFLLGDDGFGDGATMDMADFRLAIGQNWLVSGDISLATRRLFIDADGKPVDPTTATASLGAPAILFSGDASTFPVNQGTGGVFTLTGSLTNASTSPSD
jgi:hypothetical protein